VCKDEYPVKNSGGMQRSNKTEEYIAKQG
jgi:hypothetical protein